MMKIKPLMGDVKNLETYNEADYFKIKKLYDNNELVGYAAIFLAYNGIDTNNISVEEIVYWGKNIPVLGDFIEKIITSTDYPFDVNEVYYNSELIPEYLHGTFEMYGCQPTTKTR